LLYIAIEHIAAASQLRQPLLPLPPAIIAAASYAKALPGCHAGYGFAFQLLRPLLTTLCHFHI